MYIANSGSLGPFEHGCSNQPVVRGIKPECASLGLSFQAFNREGLCPRTAATRRHGPRGGVPAMSIGLSGACCHNWGSAFAHSVVESPRLIIGTVQTNVINRFSRLAKLGLKPLIRLNSA